MAGSIIKTTISLMDSKHLFFYPALFACLLWTVYSLLQIFPYAKFLRNEAPTCTVPNENRDLIFFSTIVLFMAI